MSFLLFLDFDGVTHHRSGSPAFLPECMNAFNQAVDEFDIEIVVSSSWRETNHFYDLEAFLKPIHKPVVGVTPVIDDPFLKAVRFHEIQQYRKDKHCESWVAIDDSPGFFPADCKNVYYTDPKSGFTDKDTINFKTFVNTLLSENSKK
jgi:hypothetical protein